jgi:DNA-binding MarR family transcriptional regulator
VYIHSIFVKPNDPYLRVAMECTAAKLRRTSRALSNAFDERLAPAGIRSTQFSLLVAVRLAGGMSLTGLAERLALDRTTLTRNLKPLLREKLLRRAPSKDRRVRLLALTAAGERVMALALPLWEQAQQSIVEGLGAADWARLVEELASVEALSPQGAATPEG